MPTPHLGGFLLQLESLVCAQRLAADVCDKMRCVACDPAATPADGPGARVAAAGKGPGMPGGLHQDPLWVRRRLWALERQQQVTGGGGQDQSFCFYPGVLTKF